MKRLIVLILIAGVMLYTGPAVSADSNSLENKVIVKALLDAFPTFLTAELIDELYNSGYGYGEIAIMCAIATRNGNISLDDVKDYVISNPELGWGEIAKYFGVNLSKLGTYHRLDKDNLRRAAIEYLLERNYGVINEALKNLQLHGLSEIDILTAYSFYNILDQENSNVDILNNILRLREQHRSWLKIMEEFGISETSIVSTVNQVRQEVKDMVKEEAKNREISNKSGEKQNQGKKQLRKNSENR